MQRKAQAILTSLEKSGTCSKQALNWLTLATDPFHDGALEPAGFPDINTVPTLVQQFTQTVSIDSSNSGSGPTWDCHVFFAPFSPDIFNAVPTQMVRADFEARNQYLQSPPPGSGAQLQAGFNVVKVTPGQPWYVGGLNPAAAIAMPDIIEGGCYRLIAAGVEVVNTTPDLYKQGAVTYYRTPSHSQVVTPYYNQTTLGGVFEWPMTMESFALPPFTQAAAQLYPTSRTMAAEEGYYGIATLNKNPEFLTGVGCPPFGVQAPTIENLRNAAARQIAFIPGGWPTATRPINGSGRVLPYDINGAIFTGLSAQTTLQVTTRYFVERIPSSADPDLLVLTRSPTPFDPTVQEIYSRVLSQLPIGCTVKENPLGEWFNDVLEAVVDYAPAVGAAFGPMGAAAGKIVAGGSKKLLKSRMKTQYEVPRGFIGPIQQHQTRQHVLEDSEKSMRKRPKESARRKKPQNKRGQRKKQY